MKTMEKYLCKVPNYIFVKDELPLEYPSDEDKKTLMYDELDGFSGTLEKFYNIIKSGIYNWNIYYFSVPTTYTKIGTNSVFSLENLLLFGHYYPIVSWILAIKYGKDYTLLTIPTLNSVDLFEHLDTKYLYTDKAIALAIKSSEFYPLVINQDCGMKEHLGARLKTSNSGVVDTIMIERIKNKAIATSLLTSKGDKRFPKYTTSFDVGTIVLFTGQVCLDHTCPVNNIVVTSYYWVLITDLDPEVSGSYYGVELDLVYSVYRKEYMQKLNRLNYNRERHIHTCTMLTNLHNLRIDRTVIKSMDLIHIYTKENNVYIDAIYPDTNTDISKIYIDSLVPMECY